MFSFSLQEHARYMELTEEKTREYEALKADDRRLAKEIDILMKKNNDLQSQVSRWKKKITGKIRSVNIYRHLVVRKKIELYKYQTKISRQFLQQTLPPTDVSIFQRICC